MKRAEVVLGNLKMKRAEAHHPLISIITELIFKLIPVPQMKLFSPPKDIPKYIGALVDGKNSELIEKRGLLLPQ